MNPRRLPSFVFLAGALVLLSGCAATQTASAPAVFFPTRAEVAKIPSKPPLAAVFGTEDVAASEWSVCSPPLPSNGPYDDDSPWGAFARELVKPRAATAELSPALKCAAAEVGRFHLQNHALPADSLRRFMVARCGGETSAFSPYVWWSDAPAGVSEEQILARARDTLASAVEGPLAHGHHLVGVAAARDGKRVAVVVAIGADEARLESGTRAADASHRVTLRGTARGDYSLVGALVNRGEFGASRCESDARIVAPRFAVTCELAPGDPSAWVEVIGQKRGRVMLSALSEVLIYQRDATTVTYQAKSYGAAAPVATPSAFTSALVDRVNGVRTRAKLKTLTFAAKQSKENERLAGTILDAALTKDDDSAEKAAVGLLAGWDVEGGTIRNGEFFLAAVAPTNDATAWLDFALERPLGRLTLLDPEARLIAVGPAIPEGASGLGATVTTYSLFESDDHTADEALFVRRIAAERAARGLAAPVRLTLPTEIRELAADVRRGKSPPMAVLNEMLSSAVWTTGGSVQGYAFETSDLTNVAVPDLFLKSGPLGVGITITHHRAPGAAWGQYVIFVLLPLGASEASTESASSDESATPAPTSQSWAARLRPARAGGWFAY